MFGKMGRRQRDRRQKSLIFSLFIFGFLFVSSAAAAGDMPVRAIDHGKLSPPSVGQPSAVSGNQKGSASYTFPIPLPKFFIDFPLALSYDSGAANGPSGEFGSGWGLSLPEIKHDLAREKYYLNGHLLIRTGKNGDDTEYRTIIENHQRILFNEPNQKWEITSPDGTRMVLADAAIYPDAGKQYRERWRLSSIRIPLGHEIRFRYRTDIPSASGYRYP